MVVTKFSPYLYRTKLKNSVLITNHNRLKPCRDRKLPDWLVNFRDNFLEALTDKQPDNSTGSHQPVYCVCRKPDRGDFMIHCDVCTEWFHGTCVNVAPEDALLIKKYKCPQCVKRKGKKGSA